VIYGDPGDAPQQVFLWAMQAVAKAGTVAIVGVYPESMENFPIGSAMTRGSLDGSRSS
jgi:threonine dehydrogenase-like Zn-dependent dehydrogenase